MEDHDKYTAEELIDDLMAEIQKYSEELALLFPERLLKKNSDAEYSTQQLSRFWGCNEMYVSNLLFKYKKNKDFRISDKALSKLRQIIHNRLGNKGSIYLEIIDEYENSELNLMEFILSLRYELGCISGEIAFTQEEASQILAFSVQGRLNDIRHNYQDYKFSLRRLNDMIERLELVFAERAENCYKLIQKYKNLNKDLKEYPKQKHNVGNPHYFKDILPGDFDKAYIFGFLGHDGFLSTNYRIGLRINPKDKIIIDKLIYLINLDKNKVKIRPETILQIYNGERKEYLSIRLEFGCLPMHKELENLGDIGSGSDEKEVPPVIKKLVEVAKQKSLDEWIWDDWRDTPEGQTALAWLLGAYDADGTHQSGYYGVIFSSHKSYLEEIKNLFEINTRVREVKEPGLREVFNRPCFAKGAYSLSISSKNVFVKMMENYWYSLDRKRPDKYKLSSSELDNYLSSLK